MDGAMDYTLSGMEQQAPAALAELHAAIGEMHPHALPVIDASAFNGALALQAAGMSQDQAAAMAAANMGANGGQLQLAGDGGGGGVGRRLSGGSNLKGRSGPQYCQVEGCNTALEGLKEYHLRYKVCEEHLKTPFIIRDGQQVRFCQQCGRFQPLTDFDDNKRSCRVRLQRHNERRRKKPKDGTGGGGGGGGASGGGGGTVDMSEYGTASAAAAAAEMAKLAALPYAGLASGGAGAIPISTKEMQAMQDALNFASTTLMHSSAATGKPTGEEGGEEGGEGAAGMAPASMPFVPTPDVMMLLLKGYAAMFHYVLDSATISPLAPPSDLPEAAAAAGGAGMGPLDALQLQQLAQGVFGATGAGLPLLPGGEMMEGGEDGGEGEEGAAGEEADGAAGAGPGSGLEGEEGQQQQQQSGEGSPGESGPEGELTAEEVEAALEGLENLPVEDMQADGEDG